MAKLYKGTREILRLAGGVKNVKTLYAAGKIVYGKKMGGDDFLFLTYFNNFDSSSRIDHPIFGNSYEITSSLGPSNASIVFNGFTYPAVSFYHNYDNTYYVNMLPNLEDKKVYSAELIFQSASSYFNYASLAADCFAYERGYSGNVRGFWLDNWVNFEVNHMRASTTWSSWTGWKFEERQPNIPFHVAFVYDFIKYKMRGYINGNLAFIIDFPYSKYELIKQARFGGYRSPLFLSQIALREGDFSVNGGENFPVPTEPYAKI